MTIPWIGPYGVQPALELAPPAASQSPNRQSMLLCYPPDGPIHKRGRVRTGVTMRTAVALRRHPLTVLVFALRLGGALRSPLHRLLTPSARRVGVVVVVFLALAGGVPGSATASHSLSNNLGRLSVIQPCCGGASLQGSRASIRDPVFYTLPYGTGGLSSVSVEGNSNLQGGGLMQAGVKYSNQVGYHIANCEVAPLGYWSEVFDQNGTRCFFIGYASSYSAATHKFSVQRQNPNTYYQVFMDGVPPAGLVITGTPSVDGNVGLVGAGGEITYRSGYSIAGVDWEGQFGGNGNTPWQRWNGTLGWVTIQTPNRVRNDGGWTLDTATLPTVWYIYF